MSTSNEFLALVARRPWLVMAQTIASPNAVYNSLDRDNKYWATALLFVTDGLPCLDLEDVTFGDRRLQNLPSPRRTQVNQLPLHLTQRAHQITAGKYRSLLGLWQSLKICTPGLPWPPRYRE